jgi:hypothetical protein
MVSEMSEQVPDQSLRTPPPDLAPQSPAAAFERFIELVRSSSVLFDADPEAVFSLLRPFLANPRRDEPHVREIVEAYGYARMSKMFRRLPLKQMLWLSSWGKLRGTSTMEQYSPELIKRLRDLEATLRTELRPGSITLQLKPVRYLDTPDGLSERFHRYRVQVQTLIESTPEDALQAVAVELTVNAGAAELVVDDISPQAGFSAVGIKETGGLQVGHQQMSSEKDTVGAEISAVGAKVSIGAESASTEQSSTLVTIGGEKTVARVEQYLIARRIGNRAMWRALASVGPIDAAGAEYTADVLIPADSQGVDVRVGARVEWLRAGAVPAELRRTVVLPRPAVESRLVAD